MKMDIMLSKEELERQQHMFSPHAETYALEGKGFIIALYVEKTSQKDLEEAPMTC
jgi:hypothetical protein